MDILVLHRKGLTRRQIAKRLGISRNTVKKYIDNQGYPESDRSKPNRKSLPDRESRQICNVGATTTTRTTRDIIASTKPVPVSGDRFLFQENVPR